MNYENTHIYQRSLELVSLARQIISELPVGYAFLADQLRRSSASIVLNFAEGYDKGSIKEQRRYVRISRGSAQEVSAILDVAVRFEVIREQRYTDGKELCTTGISYGGVCHLRS